MGTKERCTVRLSLAEYTAFCRRCERAGMTQQEFLRRAALNAPILNNAPLLEAAMALKRLGVLANQVARRANMGTPAAAEELRELKRGLEEKWLLLSAFLQKLEP